MKYELTEEQKMRKKMFNKFIYLAHLYPMQYRVKHIENSEELVISLHERNFETDKWEFLDFLVLKFENNFPWPWKQKLPNGKKNDSSRK